MPEKKIKSKWIKEHKLNYRGIKDNVIFQEFYEGKFTKEDIRKHTQARSDGLKNKQVDGDISVAIKYPDVGWRSGYFSKVGDKVRIYDHNDSSEHIEEPSFFTGFSIFTTKSKPNKGGADKHNDCLFNCLQDVIELPWTYPSSMKQYLKLKRDDCVSIDLIPTLETKLKKYKINVSGDHIYTSTKEAVFEINLKLVSGHYSIDRSKAHKIHGIAFAEKQILFSLIKKGGDGTIQVYDGKFKTLTKAEFSEIKSKPFTSSYTIVPCNETDDAKIKTEYDEYCQVADQLKTLTYGKINLFKTGTCVKTALKLFYDFAQYIQPDVINQDEAEWIQRASYKANIYAEKYTGPGYKYDFCSMYPSSMANARTRFPVKRGTFKNITDAEFEVYAKAERDDSFSDTPYGFYRCKIESTDPKVFVENPNYDYYSHIDVKLAFSLNIPVKLHKFENEPNALVYTADKLSSGNMMFGNFVSLLFQLKQKAPKGSKLGYIIKQILNCLWGKLSQQCSVPIRVDTRKVDVIDISDDKEIVSILPVSEHVINIKVVSNRKYFETNFARIKPFVLAYGRNRLSKYIEPYKDDIVRIHTDGFISKTDLKIESDKTLGNVVYEGHCSNVAVQNCNDVEGEFVI